MKPVIQAVRAIAFVSVAPLLSATPVHLTSPVNYQVVQRDASGAGTLSVAGSLAESVADAVTIQFRILGGSANANWNDLATLPPGARDFHTPLSLRAGGWYRLEVRAFSVPEGPEDNVDSAVDHVGVGEVFVIAGQSNSANHGEERQLTQTGRVATFTGTEWVICRDPQSGASGDGGSFVPPFGDAIAERFKVPVGIIATGVGATSVREWLPRGERFPNPPTLTRNVTQISPHEWESQGTLFERFIGRLTPLGPRGFRAVLWHQGESDANQKDPSRTLPGALYRKHMESLIRETSRRIGWNPPWFVAQASYHTPDDPGSPDLRAAQKALWTAGIAFEGPDTDALTGTYRDGGGKGVHFSGPGLREHGSRWAEKVGTWLTREA
ncbi:MAG: sialate O-acetylesterase, partial [Limisphaerales bacterium]